MRPLKRSGVHKSSGAKHFKHQVSKTKGANVAHVPMRGGWRL